jgi:glycosyltransferase involved in cell wall biosynthesis
VIGTAARLAPLKGLEYLVEAVAELHHRGVECELRIAGEGPTQKALESMVRTLRIADRVSLLGLCHQMPDFYRTIDVFALPSLSEGFPLSVVEAMASGLPVVSTFVSGIPEAVVDGVTGKLIPARNATALADALEPLLRSPALRLRMGRAGRARAETELSLKNMIATVAALYCELRSDHTPRIGRLVQ